MSGHPPADDGRAGHRAEGRIVNIQFITSMAVITPDPEQSRALYVSALGLPLQATEGDEYLHSEDIEGAKHFGVWPLRQAAQACFASDEWPADRPVPQASVEFEGADAPAEGVGAGALGGGGLTLPPPGRAGPGGPQRARLQAGQGAIA